MPSKGVATDWVAKQFAQGARKIGCRGRLVIRTEGEASILSLAEEIARERGDLPTILERPPPYDSRANGYVERAVRSVEEQTRVLKVAFQDVTGRELAVDTPSLAWLVEHAADTLNKALVSADGRTAYERVRGRKYHVEMFEFG